VEILRNDTVVGTLSPNPNMTGGNVRATWVAKAPSADWRTVRLRFRVTAGGVTCTSSNEFTFRQRPTTGWIRKNVPHPSGNGFRPVHEKHTARLERERVYYSLRLKTSGDPFDATKQAAAKSLIESVWNGGFRRRRFHRTRCQRGAACDCPYDCCKARFRLNVRFVTDREHVVVQIHADAPPAAVYRSSMNGNGGNWADPNRCSTTEYAHEVGHVLGQFDEYAGAAIDPSGVQPVGGPTANLMKDASCRVLLKRHYRRVLAFLNANAAGDPYEIVPR